MVILENGSIKRFFLKKKKFLPVQFTITMTSTEYRVFDEIYRVLKICSKSTPF